MPEGYVCASSLRVAESARMCVCSYEFVSVQAKMYVSILGPLPPSLIRSHEEMPSGSKLPNCIHRIHTGCSQAPSLMCVSMISSWACWWKSYSILTCRKKPNYKPCLGYILSLNTYIDIHSLRVGISVLLCADTFTITFIRRASVLLRTRVLCWGQTLRTLLGERGVFLSSAGWCMRLHLVAVCDGPCWRVYVPLAELFELCF